MKDRTSLLTNLLRPIVQEWGPRDVELALSKLSLEDSESRDKRLNAVPHYKRPLSAIEQVNRSTLPDAHKEALRELALRYDRKQFLPSTSDTREFIMMMGQRPASAKNRSDAFRHLIKAVSTLSLDHLAQLVDRSFHSGPSKLGPLSDAISSAAASLPRNRGPDGS